MKEHWKTFLMVAGVIGLVYLAYRCLSASKTSVAKIRGPMGFACLPPEPLA